MAIVQAGTVNPLAQNTPGVLVVQNTPAVTALSGVASNVLGLVGTASWGPVDTPVTISGYDGSYQASFGPLINRSGDLGTVVSVAAAQGATNIVAVRRANNAIAATGYANSGGLVGATFTAAYPGSLGNQVAVSFTQGAKAGTIRTTVALPAISKSETYDNIANTSAFWTNLNAVVAASNLVNMAVGNATAAPMIGNSTILTGGNDGVATLTPSQMIGSNGGAGARTGIYALMGQKTSVIHVADCNSTSVWGAISSLATSETSYAFISGTAGETIANASANLDTVGIDTNYARVYLGDHLLWNDAVNGVQRYVPSAAFEAGRKAALSPNFSTLNATGGQFPLKGVLGSMSGGSYIQADTDLLKLARIDVVGNPSPGGAYWSALQGINTSSNSLECDDAFTSMSNFVDRTFDAGMGAYVGKPLDDALLNDMAASLNGFAIAMMDDGLISIDSNGNLPFSIVCNEALNPQTQEALGYAEADVTIRFNATTRNVIVNNLSSAGATV